jgi:4'-phosphopantetheinyl transferase EntD
MRLRALERRLSKRLEAPIFVTRSDAGIDPAKLTLHERNRLSGLRYLKRRNDWLLGRNALKEVLLACNRDGDTTSATFPGSRISLTHAGNIAFAAGTASTACGLGIDYEPLRPLDERVARWFLNEVESDWLSGQPEAIRVSQMVRLWTIKEAAYKSHPNNRQMTLSDFAISEPSAHVSDVMTGGPRIKVTSEACGSGHLSVAVFGEQ